MARLGGVLGFRGRRAVAGVAVFGLIGAVAVLAPAPPARGAALSGTATTYDVTAPLLDEESAMQQAMASGTTVEVTALTTETRRVVADPVGQVFQAEISAGPARVQDPVTNSWRPVDTTLVSRPDGTVGPAAAPMKLSFSGGDLTTVASISDGVHSAESAGRGSFPSRCCPARPRSTRTCCPTSTS